MSSQALGELPGQSAYPLELPETLDSKRLDDLLFKVGFFRLEDSGLVPSPKNYQVLLRKHRMSFDGRVGRWEAEVQREFPFIAGKLKQVMQSNPLKGGSILSSLAQEHDNLRSWVAIEAEQARPLSSGLRKACARWIQRIQKPEEKVYHVSPSLSQPFSQFLVEHARKWSVDLIEDGVQLKKSLGGFRINSNIKAKRLVVNSLGGARLLSTLYPKLFSNTVSHWLFYDRVHCSVDEVPEPLADVSYFNLTDSEGQPRTLFVQKDQLRDRAVLTICTWLPSEDSKLWLDQVKEGREQLKKIVPFLEESAFSNLPSIFELTEMKGECIRRGELDRLIFNAPDLNPIHRFRRHIRSVRPGKNTLNLGPRILVSAPHLLGSGSRRDKLEACLKTLEGFDKRGSKKQTAQV